MSNFILSGYRAQLATFKKYLKKAESDPRPKNIHGLRVSIKKLRAFNKIVEPYLTSPEEVRFLHLFDILFDVAGKLRETQVNFHLVSACENKYWHQYRLNLKHTAKQAKKDFGLELKRFSRKDLKDLEKVVARSLRKQKTPLQSTVIYLSASLHHICALLQNAQNDQPLHSIRKYIRRATETLRLIRGQKVKFDRQKLVSGLTKIQDQIGDWHDQVVLVTSVEHYVESQSAGTDLTGLHQQIEKMRSKTSDRRAELFEQVKQHLPALIRESGVEV